VTLKKTFLYLFLALGILFLWLPQFERSLWHDEEQVVFGAKMILETGHRQYLQGESAVFENLNDWELDPENNNLVFSPWADNQFAAVGFVLAERFGAEEPWKWARWPFMLCGLAQVFMFSLLVAKLGQSQALGWLAGLAWLSIPWVWTMSVQLRYYPVCWLLVTWAIYLCYFPPKRYPLIVWASQILMLYFSNWSLAALCLIFIFGLQLTRDHRKCKELLKFWAMPVVFILLHATLMTDLLSVMGGVDKKHSILFVFWKHLAEFNCDVFPLSLLALLIFISWRNRELRPLALSCLGVLSFLLVSTIYTRFVMMFLPLFMLYFMLVFNELSLKKPFWASLIFLLWSTTFFFQNLPGAVLGSFSPRASRLVMPLNRSWGGMIKNSQMAWAQVADTKSDFLQQQIKFLKEHLNETDQVAVAMDATALDRLGGLRINWKKPPWAEKQQREMTPNFNSPEGVKAVIVRQQWAYLSRSATWVNQILRGIEEGWIEAKAHDLDVLDLKYFNYPVAFSKHRQSWPVVTPLRIWVLRSPITAEQAERLMALEALLRRPEGLDSDQYPDDIWGWPLNASKSH
jgi:hypothetical protein